MMERVLASEGASLYGHFEIVPVRNFNFADSRAFLSKKLEGLGVGEIQTDFLITITGGHPFYLDILAFRIMDIARESGIRKTSGGLLSDAISRELFHSSGTIYLHIRDLIDRSLSGPGYGTYISILQAIASGSRYLAQIASYINKEASSLVRQMRRVIELDLITKDGAGYFFSDPLFETWMRYVYPMREQSYIPEIASQMEKFKSQVEEMIGTFKGELGKGAEARVRELIRDFDGRGTLQGKGLPKFDQVERGHLTDTELDVVARKGNDVWVFEVKDTNVGNEIILAFMDKLERIKEANPQKKIIVALGGIDSVALKLARKEGIWVWTIEDVNQLMRYYGHFPIIV
jgi:AAA+ ATPase superfamily predicted ATPase